MISWIFGCNLQAWPRARIRGKWVKLATAALFSAASTCCLAQASATEFAVIPLSAGIQLIQAEVASSESQREKGLMFREQLGTNQGMVFVFDFLSRPCMWMKNTLLPLSVAFMDDGGRIINIEDMRAQTLDSHCAARAARYALEMNLGWFSKHGIGPGQKLGGLPRPPQ